MAETEEIKRIYRIEIPGLDDVTNKLQQLNEELELQKAIKKEASKILLVNKDDAAVIEKQTKIIAQSEVAITKLSAEKRIAQKEAAAMIAAVEKEAKAHVDQANATKFAAGSVNEAAASYKALLALVKAAPTDGLINWKGEAINIDVAKTHLTGYRKVVDDFNRSLSPDGTLVGEYKSGILNAFKSLGLDSLIKDQKFKIEREISDLIVKNQQLVANFKNTGQVGPEAFQRIAPEVERNIKRQQELEGQLRETNAALRTHGTIGKEVTGAIGKGFENLITTGLGAAGVFLGLQSVFDFLGKSNEEFKQAELNALRLQNALRNVGRERYFDDLVAQANTLSKNIGYIDNDDIVRAQEKLVTFGKLTKKQIEELIPTIIDLAANLGVDLPAATDIVLKALNGQGRGLKEYGINLKEGKTTAENFNIVQTELKKRVEGSALALRNSLAGAAKTADQELKDLQEEVGAKSAPLWNSFKAAVLQGVDGLLSFNETVKNTINNSALLRKLFFFTDAVKEFNKEQLFNKTPLGQYTQQVKETMTILPGLLAELNTKSAKDQKKFVESQDVFIDSARQDYLALKNSGTATAAEISKAAARLDAYKKIKAELQKQVTETNKDTPAFADTKTPEQLKAEADAAEKARKDLLEKKLKDIDSAEFKAQFILEKHRAQGKLLEGEYDTTLFEIHKKSQDDRIALLEKGNADEKSRAAKFRLDQLKDEAAYNDKVYDIIRNRIEVEKNIETIAAQDEANRIINDPTSTPKRKAEAQVKLNEELLRIQKKRDDALTNAEKVFNKKSEDNQRERGEVEKGIQREINNAQLQVVKEGINERLALIDDDEIKKITARTERLRDQVTSILNGNKPSAKKVDLIGKAKDQASLDSLDIEIASDKKRLEIFKEQLKQKQISQVDFDKFQEALINKQVAREERAAQISIDKERKKQEVKQEILKSAEQIISDFLNAEFSAREQQLDRDKTSQEERLDKEKELVEAQAQSADERASIDKQYEVKKREIDKEAGERMKKQKLKELAILTAVGVGQALASAPFPINLIDAAAVLLTAAIQRGVINSQTFAGGGRIQRLGNGRITAAPNVPALPNGDNVLAYVKPGEVILNKAQQRRLGGDAIFRSIGVPGFALGGRVLGDGLQPPSNPSSFLTAGNTTTADLSEMFNATNSLIAATNSRIDRLVVVNNVRDLSGVQRKIAKNDKLGSL